MDLFLLYCLLHMFDGIRILNISIFGSVLNSNIERIAMEKM